MLSNLMNPWHAQCSKYSVLIERVLSSQKAVPLLRSPVTAAPCLSADQYIFSHFTTILVTSFTASFSIVCILICTLSKVANFRSKPEYHFNSRIAGTADFYSWNSSCMYPNICKFLSLHCHSVVHLFLFHILHVVVNGCIVPHNVLLCPVSTLLNKSL